MHIYTRGSHPSNLTNSIQFNSIRGNQPDIGPASGSACLLVLGAGNAGESFPAKAPHSCSLLLLASSARGLIGSSCCLDADSDGCASVAIVTWFPPPDAAPKRSGGGGLGGDVWVSGFSSKEIWGWRVGRGCWAEKSHSCNHVQVSADKNRNLPSFETIDFHG